ncbi:MAG: hypothetical protein RQ763_09430 [Sulfurimonas sp.]|uniref:hypothetical protein n=1 Tax=Sulfurimonas sp. TaxID=2022749 RepID=UPI0028CF5E60|nr:hypothetical protein [Sulfurimonas sp.]MDT8339409.1 hypothetical protein [Sulfurimonas sp.]
MKIVKSTLFSALVLSTLSLGGCMTKDLVNHTFEFDARSESPDIEVLDYLYGNSKLTGVRPPDWAAKDTPKGFENITGPIHRGDSLYVKWRIKATGEVFEDRVDLKDRLPINIEKHRIHFLVKGRQLYVYLISPQKNPNPWVKPPLSMYSHLKVDEIYPAQPKF